MNLEATGDMEWSAADSQEGLASAFETGQVIGAAGPIERIDTHLSHIFLAGERVFKLKRAIRLPFVDFYSCEKRGAACQAEIDVNRRMAAALYLDARPVTREPDGRYSIGGRGAVVDWVVVMRRFDQALQFDRLAQSGQLTLALVERVAGNVARLHAAAPATDLTGHAVDYRHVLHDLRETERDGAAKLGLHPGSPRLFDALESELLRVGALIERRRREGKVRRGHGDLHLRNICVYQGEPMAFDALEFDERLATTDVLYDLSFLLMDLRRNQLPAHANAAMNAYWDEAAEDEDALELLGFFMGLRAAVRMAVAVEAGDLGEAQAYRALGLELLTRAPPMLVAIGGLSGSGKSAVAAALAPLLRGPAGARLLRSDVLRKRALGLSLDQAAGAQNYAPERRAEIYRDLASHAVAALAVGASVVADATFQAETTRALIEGAAQGARFNAFWLDAPLPLRLARVARRAGDASDADAAVAAAQEEPEWLGPAWRRVNANQLIDNIVQQVAAEAAI